MTARTSPTKMAFFGSQDAFGVQEVKGDYHPHLSKAGFRDYFQGCLGQRGIDPPSAGILGEKSEFPSQRLAVPLVMAPLGPQARVLVC